MKINHIVDRNWASYWNKRIKESNRYDIRLYRFKKDSFCGYRYRLVCLKNNYYVDMLQTNSKDELKITLDLMGLKIKQVNIFITENLNGSINVIFSHLILGF